MDILTVFANKEALFANHAIVRVFWRTGLHRIKALDVRLALTCQDPQAAAEAVAIRYLLGEANIFNDNRTGINLKIVVSKGAIKKMARQATTKLDLYEYGYPILTRYGEAEISVSKDRSWFPEPDQLKDTPVIDGEAMRGIEKIDSAGMGNVAVTRHALERYREHCGTSRHEHFLEKPASKAQWQAQSNHPAHQGVAAQTEKIRRKPEVWMSP
jgi:hypothetical protein